ncbi:hypothetical protein FUA48_16165 [Flavobacterium alkalisoli]|uniref:Uncharacterized protein n=1 Tax=Flavobacterium alkalisoli TaxID=2602769 RepID=A0A5B9FVV2_9FLAO|nr:hypothetical protein [Flavobacterium alkalisoli]QEE51055.1 hypothetical protein FUA48_16165 [Flavobacterium alkalisoli]
MKKILTLFLLLSTAVTLQAQELTGATLKDFVFKSKAQLTSKYGKPVEVISSDEETRNLESLLGYTTYSWTLKNELKIEVTYTEEKVQTVRVDKYKFNKDRFYLELNWDKPTLKKVQDYVEIKGLKGFDAKYYNQSSELVLFMENPNIKTFGKKK